MRARARAGTLVSLISIHYIRACEWCRYLLLFLEMRNWKKIKRFAVIELPEGNIPSQPVLWTAKPSHSATANCRSRSLMIHSLCFVIRATLRGRSAQFHYDVCMCSAPHCLLQIYEWPRKLGEAVATCAPILRWPQSELRSKSEYNYYILFHVQRSALCTRTQIPGSSETARWTLLFGSDISSGKNSCLFFLFLRQQFAKLFAFFSNYT